MHLAELELFKAMVIKNTQRLPDGEYYTDMADRGIVLDFKPNAEQQAKLKKFRPPLDIKVMFGLDEKKNSNILRMLTKQITHYFITYGLGAGDVFDITTDAGEIVTITKIKGVSVSEMSDMVLSKMYANAPAKDIELYKKIIDDYSISYDADKIENNELRIMMYDPKKHTLRNGDDIVRYMVFKATGDTMLVKSRETINEISCNKLVFNEQFFNKNESLLAEVFNRHKKIIMAAKGTHNRSAINRVSRLSKSLHKPVYEAVSKRFIAERMKGNDVSVKKLSTRDKMKILNVIEWHLGRFSTEMYQIRNGKAYTTNVNRNYPTDKLNSVKDEILISLADDLSHLNGKEILLDARVDYGLPISNKQTVGNIPFWSEVRFDTGTRISSGIYWENSWGARDLDLSTIDIYGARTGWNTGRGYTNKEPMFSGDVTNAHNGAMEFMTSTTASYANYVNIFSGNNGSECEIVVGTEGKDRWIKDVVAREKIKLNSRQMITGFVKQNKFVFYTGRYGNSRISFSSNPVIDKMKCDMWTVQRLFDAVGIKYSLDKDADVEYDYDMSYNGFTYDKLEKLMGV